MILTGKECLKLLGIIKTLFPNEKQPGEDDIKVRAMFWADIFKDISFGQAVEGLKKYCATNTSGFAPQPAHIINCARQANRLSDTAIEFYLHRALCDSTYHSEEQFDRLPEDLKKIIGSPAELRRQALRETDDTRIYIAKVCKEYRTRVESGTLDNTLLVTAAERTKIAETVKKLGAVE